MKQKLLIVPVMFFLLSACNKQPLADARISLYQAYVNESISFTNLSQNADRVEWDMGDGTVTNEWNPIYAYDSPGQYTVRLLALGKKGDRDEAYYSIVVITRQPVADAAINPNPAWVGEDITFTNLSSNTAYSEWDLGDGNASSSYNVVHYYKDPGIYNVSLKSFNNFNEVNTASFIVDVVGSELKIVVKEYFDEYLIEDASVLLYATENDWYEADVDKAVGGEQFTNSYGECWFEGLSSQKYYVDVYYRLGNEGFVNWLLGEEDIGWVETQEVMGGYDHTFIAYVDAVTFDDQKKSTGRLSPRPSHREPGQFKVVDTSDKLPKVNKSSTRK